MKSEQRAKPARGRSWAHSLLRGNATSVAMLGPALASWLPRSIPWSVRSTSLSRWRVEALRPGLSARRTQHADAEVNALPLQLLSDGRAPAYRTMPSFHHRRRRLRASIAMWGTPRAKADPHATFMQLSCYFHDANALPVPRGYHPYTCLPYTAVDR